MKEEKQEEEEEEREKEKRRTWERSRRLMSPFESTHTQKRELIIALGRRPEKIPTKTRIAHGSSHRAYE